MTLTFARFFAAAEMVLGFFVVGAVAVDPELFIFCFLEVKVPLAFSAPAVVVSFATDPSAG